MDGNYINYNYFFGRLFALAYLRGGDMTSQDLGPLSMRLDYNGYLKDMYFSLALIELEKEGFITKSDAVTVEGLKTTKYSITESGIKQAKKMSRQFTGLLHFLDEAYGQFLD